MFIGGGGVGGGVEGVGWRGLRREGVGISRTRAILGFTSHEPLN